MCRILGLPNEGGEAPPAPRQGMFIICLVVSKSKKKNVNAYLKVHALFPVSLIKSESLIII